MLCDLGGGGGMGVGGKEVQEGGDIKTQLIFWPAQYD